MMPRPLLPLLVVTLSVSPAWAESPPVFLQQWGAFGSGNGQFKHPQGIAVDASGNVYVADTDNQRIQKFDHNGSYLRQWGSTGTGNGQFNTPTGLTTDASGNVYVADQYNHRIQKFNSSGSFISTWGTFGTANGQFSYPRGVTVDGAGNVYVADQENNRVQKFTTSGGFLTAWGSLGSADGQFNNPTGVATDAVGNVYVTDGNNARVEEFTSTGSLIAKWGSSGAADGQLSAPLGICADVSGNLYVADANNNRIQKFGGGTGTFIVKWGSLGSGVGQLSGPGGVARDALGNLYVVDTNNHRVQKFQPAPQLRLVSARDHIEGAFLTPHTVYADRTRIYLSSYYGQLFVLSRDRAANFPLLETIQASSTALRSITGDADNLYVVADDGMLRVYHKTVPLQLSKTIALSSYSMLGAAVCGTHLYVSKGQTYMEVDDSHVALQELNQGDVGLELTTGAFTLGNTYGQTLESGTTVIYDRLTGQRITGINDGALPVYVDNRYFVQVQNRGSLVFLYDPASLQLIEPITRPYTNAAERRGQWLIGGSEYGQVDVFDLSHNPAPLVNTANLRALTGHTGVEDIEIRSLWSDAYDNLIFAGSSWGNDQSRGPTLPSFFVLELENIGDVSDPGGCTSSTVDVSMPASGGTDALGRSVPNPVAHLTRIPINRSRLTGEASLRIFDLDGRGIREWRVTPDRTSGSGDVFWDARDTAGRLVPAGVYFYRLFEASRAAGPAFKLVVVR